MIYVIRCTVTGLCKIGYSTSPERRLATLQTGSPTRLELQLQLPGPQELERELHQRFAVVRSHGEWFALEPDHIEHLRSLARRDFDEAPVVVGRLSDDGKVAQIRCPYCGEQHQHEATEGHRVAHCTDAALRLAVGDAYMSDADLRQVNRHGYVIQLERGER